LICNNLRLGNRGISWDLMKFRETNRRDWKDSLATRCLVRRGDGGSIGLRRRLRQIVVSRLTGGLASGLPSGSEVGWQTGRFR
jgi:hypothetical protein